MLVHCHVCSLCHLKLVSFLQTSTYFKISNCQTVIENECRHIRYQNYVKQEVPFCMKQGAKLTTEGIEENVDSDIFTAPGLFTEQVCLKS